MAGTKQVRFGVAGVALLAGVLVSSQALAWGAYGHRIVGQIAQEGLTPTAQRAVEDLLSGEAEPSLAAVGPWADTVRTRGSAPRHYVNLDETCGYKAEDDCPRGQCVVGAILEDYEVLADPEAPKQERTEALKWLVHLVGDVHTPLHAGLSSDRGGNLYQVRWRSKGSNLHQLWDSQMLQSQQIGWQQKAARLMEDAPAYGPQVTRTPAATWAIESCQIVQSEGFYPQERVIGPEYVKRWMPVVDQQLRLAGDRLAELLNSALDP